jgi:hypothetical protein
LGGNAARVFFPASKGDQIGVNLSFRGENIDYSIDYTSTEGLIISMDEKTLEKGDYSFRYPSHSGEHLIALKPITYESDPQEVEYTIVYISKEGQIHDITLESFPWLPGPHLRKV